MITLIILGWILSVLNAPTWIWVLFWIKVTLLIIYQILKMITDKVINEFENLIK